MFESNNIKYFSAFGLTWDLVLPLTDSLRFSLINNNYNFVILMTDVKLIFSQLSYLIIEKNCTPYIIYDYFIKYLSP